MSEFMTEEDGEAMALALEKLTRVVKKHHTALKKGGLLTLAAVKELVAIDFEIDESPVSQINRLLREGWKLIALNQYTRAWEEHQSWGSIAYLGRFD